MMKIQPVVLAGGVGSRLWPLSRELYPKQLLQLTSDKSLLQNTLSRLTAIPEVFSPILVVGEEHRFITKSQIEESGLFESYDILLESKGRNTAPAIYGAARFALNKHEEDVVLLVLPADHLIMNQNAFLGALQLARELAESKKIVTFGIKPTHPETGYGYIEKGDEYRVRSFKEKPDLSLAQEYVAQGNYFWNSGMFVFSAETYLAEMKQYAPEIAAFMEQAVEQGKPDYEFFRLDKSSIEACPSDSIDYALMEKTDKAAIVPTAELGWSDIGSWQALWDVSEKDTNGNVIEGDVVLHDSKNCFIHAESCLVSAVGMEDTLIVETGDAVLVMPLSQSQNVKKVVKDLKDKKRNEYISHRTVYRPWGNYTVLEEKPRYQMKRIVVNPGAKLSLQMHHHRHEHWIVVKGTAKIVNGEEDFLLFEDQSTYIPAGNLHRMENPGTIPLELIEVQIGTYLGEDDIVRFEDVYGRKE